MGGEQARVDTRVLAVGFVELRPQVADYGDVWAVVTTLNPFEVAALAIAAFGLTWRKHGVVLEAADLP